MLESFVESWAKFKYSYELLKTLGGYTKKRCRLSRYLLVVVVLCFASGLTRWLIPTVSYHGK